MGYLQTDVATGGCCQLPKPFLEEKIFSQNKKLSEIFSENFILHGSF